ncbi:phage scaffolding protein [Lysinibacillus telephonicus]|uniref:phage scaffolding protein n=1 Tax=Lysinibacillus telephonicus TaxID=1714840 RepID=UPI0037D60A69
MKKEDLIALGLSEEHATAVVNKYGTMIPKERFDEVNKAKKDLETQIGERDKQLKELGEKAKGNEELSAKIQELQDANKQAKTDYEKQLKDVQLSTAIKLALTNQVHDTDLVAGLVDKTKIELNEDGTIKGGLDDQLKTLKESKSFLFVPEKETKPNIKGAVPPSNPGGGNDPINVGADFAKMLNERGKAPSTENNPWG